EPSLGLLQVGIIDCGSQWSSWSFGPSFQHFQRLHTDFHQGGRGFAGTEGEECHVRPTYGAKGCSQDGDLPAHPACLNRGGEHQEREGLTRVDVGNWIGRDLMLSAIKEGQFRTSDRRRVISVNVLECADGLWLPEVEFNKRLRPFSIGGVFGLSIVIG